MLHKWVLLDCCCLSLDCQKHTNAIIIKSNNEIIIKSTRASFVESLRYRENFVLLVDLQEDEPRHDDDDDDD